jgi:hypothetical protein
MEGSGFLRVPVIYGRGTTRAEDAQGTPSQSHIYHPVHSYTKIITLRVAGIDEGL